MQAGGHRFDPGWLHSVKLLQTRVIASFAGEALILRGLRARDHLVAQAREATDVENTKALAGQRVALALFDSDWSVPDSGFAPTCSLPRR